MLMKWLEKYFGFKMFFSFADDVDGGGSDGGEEVTDDQLDDDGWVAKRGAKNVREELTRRQEAEKTLKAERDALNAELEKLRNPQPKPEGEKKPEGKWRPPHLENFQKKWVGKSDPDFLEDFINVLLETATGASMDISKHVLDERFKDSELEDVINDRRAAHLDKSLDKLKEKPNLKMVIERYGDEIRTMAGKELDKKLWKNPDNVEYIVGKVLTSHLSDFGVEETTTEKKTVIPKLNETGNAPASKGGVSVSDDEIAQAAFEADLNVDDPAGRKAATKLAQLKKLRDEARDKSLAGE